jgi:hypothetical protein
MRTYVVWCPDLGQEQEDGATIPATDPADAAEKFDMDGVTDSAGTECGDWVVTVTRKGEGE